MSFMKRLDRASFLRINIWDFIFRSLFKEYGRRFLIKVVLSHPVKTIQGLIKYKTFLDKQSLLNPDRSLALSGIKTFPKKIRKKHSDLLVGLGFCLKPYKSQSPGSSCPSGRANHDCLYLEQDQIQPVCSSCRIFNISRKCLDRGLRVYIMTSAEDMALDFLIPQISSGKFPLSLLFLCPYSVSAIIPALFICEADSLLFPYTEGNCKDYKQWRKADLGHKEEVTRMDAPTWTEVLDIFEKIAMAEHTPRGFRREGNVFVPKEPY